MKLDPTSAFSGPAVHARQLVPLQVFFRIHRDRIWHAARLLGGFESARIVDRCADLLDRQDRGTSRTRIMAGQILALLSLERVDDPDLPFAGYFAEIDPGDPVVSEFCILCDGLERALAETACA